MKTETREKLLGAVAELRAEHRPMWVGPHGFTETAVEGKEPVGCVMCYASDGSWPCATILITVEIEYALANEALPAPTPAHKLARTEDPGTSHEAAARVKEFSRAHHRSILDALGGPLRPRGGTQEEIARVTGLDKYQVNKRMVELERDQHVMRAGERRASTNRKQTVWVAV